MTKQQRLNTAAKVLKANDKKLNAITVKRQDDDIVVYSNNKLGTFNSSEEVVDICNTFKLSAYMAYDDELKTVTARIF